MQGLTALATTPWLNRSDKSSLSSSHDHRHILTGEACTRIEDLVEAHEDPMSSINDYMIPPNDSWQIILFLCGCFHSCVSDCGEGVAVVQLPRSTRTGCEALAMLYCGAADGDLVSASPLCSLDACWLDEWNRMSDGMWAKKKMLWVWDKAWFGCEHAALGKASVKRRFRLIFLSQFSLHPNSPTVEVSDSVCRAANLQTSTESW